MPGTGAFGKQLGLGPKEAWMKISSREDFRWILLAWPGTGAETTSRLMVETQCVVGKCSLFSCSLFPSPYPNPGLSRLLSSTVLARLFFFFLSFTDQKSEGAPFQSLNYILVY